MVYQVILQSLYFSLSMLRCKMLRKYRLHINTFNNRLYVKQLFYRQLLTHKVKADSSIYFKCFIKDLRYLEI